MTYKRAHRSGVEDRWHKQGSGTPCDNGKHGKLGTLVESAKHGTGKRWRARYVDPSGKEVERLFDVKDEARAWITAQTADIAKGSYVAPKDAVMTLDAWADKWIEAYGSRRASTVRQAKTHLKVIREEFGSMTLAEIKTLEVTTWTAKLQDRYAASTVSAIHGRLAQLLSAAVHDGYLSRNPCSRRTSPPSGRVERYCPPTDEVWRLYDAMPEHLRVAVLLGAFAGLRAGETVGLRIEDVDFMKGVVYPKVQWANGSRFAPLKTKGSSAPVPIPRELTLMLAASVQDFPGPTLVTDGKGNPVGPWLIDRPVAKIRAELKLNDKLEFHCLRHHMASLLIAEGCDVVTVQKRCRHDSARTTLEYYSHLWPDKDETTRSALGGVIAARVASSSGNPAGSLRAVRS